MEGLGPKPDVVNDPPIRVMRDGRVPVTPPSPPAADPEPIAPTPVMAPKAKIKSTPPPTEASAPQSSAAISAVLSPQYKPDSCLIGTGVSLLDAADD